jgi:hypothetical protein
MFRGREVGSVAGAIVLHAAAIYLVGLAVSERSPNPQAAPAASPAALSFDIELGDGAGTEPATSVARDVSEVSASRKAPSAARPGTADVAGDPRTAEAFVSAGSVKESDAERVETVGPERPIDLGLGPDGWQRWVSGPNVAEIPRAEGRARRANRFQVFRAPPASTTGGLQEGLEKRDRELGLGPSGRVLSALHDAARTTVAPQLGTARFDVTVHRTGAVQVTLTSASGEVERWQKVAARLADDLRSSPPRIAPQRTGMKLMVELVAEETMPNGTKLRSLKKPHVDVPSLKFKSTEQSKEQLKADNPTVENPNEDTLPATNLEQPGVYLAERGQVCDYRAGVSVLPPAAQAYREGVTWYGASAQGSCDPSQVGAKPQRTVRARVIEQSMF